jgi:hypothetical protein
MFLRLNLFWRVIIRFRSYLIKYFGHLRYHFCTTVPSTIVPCKNRGIYPSDRGIYPMDHRNKTRFMHLYYSYSRLLQEAWGSHCHTSHKNIKNELPPPRRCCCPPPPLSSPIVAAVANGSYSSWQMLPRLPARWGEGLSILLATGAIFQISFCLGGTPGWREMMLG